MKKRTLMILLGSIIIFSNLPIVNTEVLKLTDSNNFRYSNNNATFTYIENFDIFRNWISDEVVFNFISQTRPELHNMELYRLYRINPLCFWRWRYYLSVSFQFKYKSWDDIKYDREPFKPNNMWQKF